MKAVAWALALSLGALLTVPLAVVLFITTLANPAVAAGSCTPPASAAGLPQPGSPRQASLHNPPSEIPAPVLTLYEAAAIRYGVPWMLLAGVGMEETNHGRNNATSSAGARGLMQFMPATFAFYGVDGNGDGRAVITDDADSVHSAANYLVASGALSVPRASGRPCSPTTTRSGTSTTSSTTPPPTAEGTSQRTRASPTTQTPPARP